MWIWDWTKNTVGVHKIEGTLGEAWNKDFLINIKEEGRLERRTLVIFPCYC